MEVLRPHNFSVTTFQNVTGTAAENLAALDRQLAENKAAQEKATETIKQSAGDRETLRMYADRLTAEAVKGAGVEVLPVAVRECVAFGESNAAALDVFRYAPKSNGAQDYTAAAAAVLAWVSNKF